jgi:Tol biopolymer transport system component
VPDTGCATGGGPETLVRSAAPNEQLFRPEFVGDDGTLMYTRRTGTENRIFVQAPGRAARVLVEDGMDAHLTPTGHLLWIREGALLAQAIDRRSLEFVGGAVPVVESVMMALPSAVGQHSVSDTGTLVFLSGAATSEMVWVDRRTGREEPTGAPPKDYLYPRVSPDGTKVVVSAFGGDSDIYVWDFARKMLANVTSGPATDQSPVWMPDSRAVIYRSSPDGKTDLFKRNTDGSGTVDQLTNSADAEIPSAVTRDARVLVRLSLSNITSDGTLAIMPIQAGATLQPVLSPSVPPLSNPVLSPDERWIAYQSREGGTMPGIHVRPFSATDSSHWQVSPGGGERPMWSRSGRELFYVTFNPTRIMSVAVPLVRPDGPFAYGPPTVALDAERYSMGNVSRAFDISPDDTRFLMVKPIGSEGRSITVVANWFEELKAGTRSK